MAWTLKRSLLAGFAVYLIYVVMFIINSFFSKPANEIIHWVETNPATEWIIYLVVALIALNVIVLPVLAALYWVATKTWGVVAG